VYDQQNKTDQALHYLKIYLADREENTHFQMNQIVHNYKMIQTIEAKALADKLQIEKAEYLAKAKHDFLSNMSHEIRTPLNAVISIAHLLDEKVNAKTEEIELLSALKYSSNNLLSLVNNILDFSKLEEGKMELEKTTVNLRTLLNNIRNTYASLAENKGIHLALSIDERIGVSYAVDATKLAQILGNLIGNAIKFTDKGTVTLSVVEMAKDATGNQLQFKVIDTGTGIPNDFLDKLFDKFTQPKQGETQKHGGSGLGLAIVKELVALHGSSIHVSTKMGKGTIFTFDLVLEPKECPVVATHKSDEKLNDLQVLIAEDNKINMLVATKILNKWGIQPDTAENGKEALEKTKQKKYDAILMDLHMPVLNGFEATVMIRKSHNENNETPIYAFTADITADINKEYDAYFSGFLHKPIEIDKLYDVLSAILIATRQRLFLNENLRHAC
jgi:signal transduction histidine kinase/CheY-like chemotaxis protein